MDKSERKRYLKNKKVFNLEELADILNGSESEFDFSSDEDVETEDLYNNLNDVQFPTMEPTTIEG